MVDASAPSRGPEVIGVLLQVGLFPVKSVAGFSPPAAVLDAEGLRGDRSHHLLGADGEPLRAKHHPGLRDLRLSGAPQAPEVVTPDGSDLAGFLHVPGVSLRPASGGARQVAPVHVVSSAQRRAPGAGDSSRANLVVEFGADEPGPDALVGARLVVGEVVLHLGERPRHCAGLFATVAVPGRVRVGDRVSLSVPA